MTMQHQFSARPMAGFRPGPVLEGDPALGLFPLIRRISLIRPIRRIRPIRLVLAAVLACLATAPALRAQTNYLETNVTLTTLGGGPPAGEWCKSTAGLVNGNTLQVSQFDDPVSMALNSQGTLFIADYTNNALRKVTQVGNTSGSVTYTYIPNLQRVVGVAVDAADSVYAVGQSNSVGKVSWLEKYNYSGNLLFSNALPSVPVGLAVSQDSATNIFVVFANGTLYEYVQNGAKIVQTNAIYPVNQVKLNPGGIAWRNDGLLAVSDLTYNAIYTLVGATNSTLNLYVGDVAGGSGSTKGWADGAPQFAQFNQPAGLAWSPDHQLVVADRGNNALRRIDASGTTSTIYGVNSLQWGVSDCSAPWFPGWVDGNCGQAETNSYGVATNATGCAPIGVLITPSGTVYVTEQHYNTLREVEGVAFASSTNGAGGTNGTGSTNGLISPPTFSPNSGYFPDCVTIYVTSAVQNVYYTTDGTTPATNSPDSQQVLMTPYDVNNAVVYYGQFQWCNSTNDLTSLKLIAANGTNVSAATNGSVSPVSNIGFPSSQNAGAGATAIIPLVVNLQSNTTMASLQFDMEFIPTTAATPPLTNVTFLSISTNDYHRVIAPTSGTLYYESQYFPAQSNGLGVGVLEPASTNLLLNVKNYAVAALLEVKIPTNALNGQSYTLSVIPLTASGTSDGAQGNVPLTTMPSQFLFVSNVLYFEGDSSPSSGYSAGQFGDGNLNNSDVNNALHASLGMHVPIPFTDAFSAMDVYPETPGPNGEMGDGFITYLDWQHIFLRSLGIETNNWIRFWTNGRLGHAQIPWTNGQIVTNGIPPSTNFQAFIGTKAVPISQPDVVWLRQASIHAGTLAGLNPGSVYSFPVYINVLRGYSLSGLQFRAILQPNGNAPPPGQIQFTPATGLPAPYASSQGLSPNDTICAWSLFEPFTPALQGSNALGSISFQVPSSATAGQSYTLSFLAVDGSPDLETIYQLESVPGTAWVGSAALTAPQITSDEWRTNFFGSVTNAAAQDDADPDGDGMLNWQEYLAGTNPTNALSVLQFVNPVFGSASPQNINLSWLTAPGRRYLLESSPTPVGSTWTPVSTNLGDGNNFQVVLTNHPGGAAFYRIELLQP